MEIPNTYLFTAYYDDNTEYVQGADDASLQVPDKNCLYDVLFEPMKPLEKLFAFRLTAVDGAVIPADAPKTVAVNLRNGLFEIDGLVVSLYHELLDEGKPQDMRLLYYRNPAPFVEIGIKDGETKSTGYTIGYVIGWQATVRVPGKKKLQNVKKFIVISGVPQVA